MDLPTTLVFALFANGLNDLLDHRRRLCIEEHLGDSRVVVLGVHHAVPFAVDLAEFFLIGSVETSGDLMFLAIVERLERVRWISEASSTKNAYLGEEFDTRRVAGLLTIDGDFTAHFEPRHAEDRTSGIEWLVRTICIEGRVSTGRRRWERSSHSVHRDRAELTWRLRSCAQRRRGREISISSTGSRRFEYVWLDTRRRRKRLEQREMTDRSNARRWSYSEDGGRFVRQ